MTPRPLTLADLWLPGDVLDGALLRGWTGAVWALRGTEWIGATWAPHMGCAPVIYGGKVDSFAGVADVRLDFRRQEVRDRAVRVLGPDLLPIHAAELRGEITADEAAGLVWCSVLRREAAGDGVVRGVYDQWLYVPGHEWIRPGTSKRLCLASDDAGRTAADAAALAAGYSLREPGGVLLLPLPDDAIGRLEASND